MDVQPSPEGGATELTARDTVVLSLVAEGPTHGYAIETELRRRDVRDWADLSRPQVYKSIEKLLRLRLVMSIAGDAALRGPRRSTIAITAAGRSALYDTLVDTQWSSTRDRPLFLTWLALCSTLSRPAIVAGIRARRAFLQTELKRERDTLVSIAADVTVVSPFPRAMVELTIRQFEVELCWLEPLLAELRTLDMAATN